MALKIVNIVNHEPAYEHYKDRGKPEIYWDDPKGEWVGILGLEWHDRQGNLTLEVSDDIEYEVWQPDYRASKIYEHRYENGLIHKFFPAVDKKYYHGLHVRHEIYSQEIIEGIQKLIDNKEKFVLQINALMGRLNISILEKFAGKIPIVGQFYNNSKDLFTIKKTKHPLKWLNAVIKKKQLMNYYKNLPYLIPSIKENTDIFEKEFGTKVYYLNSYNFPLDLSKVENKISKQEARKKLNIDEDVYVFLSLSRLVYNKQIDKLFECLAQIDLNYLCLIVGSGPIDYTQYLKDTAKSLGIEHKVKFVGFVPKDEIYDYYSASDVFLSTSSLEGGPTTPFEAASLDVPVILTATGIAYEFFDEHKVGKIIPLTDYDVWTKLFREVIQGAEIKRPKIDEIMRFGDKQLVSEYYRDTYKDIYEDWANKN